MGRPARAGNGADCGKTRALQPGLKILAQIVFATKKMRNTGDVCQQPVDTIGSDHRRVATRPSSQAGQRRRRARQIGRASGKFGTNGAGIGKRHATRQTPYSCGRVQAMQMIGIARPMGQGKWPLNGAVPQARVAREPRKPYGKQPTRHSNSRSNFPKLPFCSY